MAVAAGYIVEQIIDSVLVGILGTLFILQIVSEYHAPKAVANVKKVYHRAGLAMVILSVSRAVDPEGVHGLLPGTYRTAQIVSANVTCLIYACILLFTYYLINALVSMEMKPKPRRTRRVMLVLSLIFWAVTNAIYAVMLALDREWIRGFAYVWYAAAFAVTVSVAEVAIVKLRRAVFSMIDKPKFKAHGKATTDPERMRKSMARLLALQVVGTALVLVGIVGLVVLARDRFNGSHTKPVYRPDPHDYSEEEEVFVYVHWAAILVFLWWAWIPMYCCQRKQGVEEPPSDGLFSDLNTPTTKGTSGVSSSGPSGASKRASVKFGISGLGALSYGSTSMTTRHIGQTPTHRQSNGVAVAIGQPVEASRLPALTPHAPAAQRAAQVAVEESVRPHHSPVRTGSRAIAMDTPRV